MAEYLAKNEYSDRNEYSDKNEYSYEYSDVFEPRIFVFVQKSKSPFRLATDEHHEGYGAVNDQEYYCI